MSIGIRVYDPSTQKILLDLTDRISRVIKEFDIPVGINSGTVTLPSFSGNTFVMVRNDERSIQIGIVPTLKSIVTVNISGSTVTWSRTLTGFGTPEYPIKVIIGVY